VAELAAIATADAVTLTSEIGAAAADIGSAMAEATLDAGVTALQAEPQADAAPPVQPEAAFDKAVGAALADVVPPVQAKPLAQAINEAAPLPASAVHPIASTVPLEAGGEVELPAVTPVERTPGGVQTRGPEQKAPRASRKK
jgi:uncharacterized protein GlcG (DUF336 family)